MLMKKVILPLSLTIIYVTEVSDDGDESNKAAIVPVAKIPASPMGTEIN